MQTLERWGIAEDDLRQYRTDLFVVVAEVVSAISAMATAKVLNAGPDVMAGVLLGENAVAIGGLWVYGKLREILLGRSS